MKRFLMAILASAFLFCNSDLQQIATITGNIQYEDGAPADTVHIGLYRLGAERFLGGPIKLQTTIENSFTLDVNPGLYTLVLYSYEFEKFRENLYIPDNTTKITLDIFLPRLSIPDTINEVVFHGGSSTGSMGWRENVPMEKEGAIWRLKDPSIIRTGEKYQIWVNGLVLWDLREKDYTVIHGWTTINNLYAGGDIIFNPMLYRTPKKEATAKISGVEQKHDLSAFAEDMNIIKKEVSNASSLMRSMDTPQIDSLYQALILQFTQLEEKYQMPFQPVIFEEQISSLTYLHPTVQAMRQIWRDAKGDTTIINAFYETEKFKNYIADNMELLNRLNPDSYLLSGWFANDFLFLDNLIKRSTIIQNELNINGDYFSDALLKFAEKTKSKECAANILFGVGSRHARNELKASQAKGEAILNRLKKEFPGNRMVTEGYVDNLLQSLKVVVGSPAPDFAIKTLTGDSLKLADMRGKFVMVDFWGSWCGPCRGEIPNFKKLYQTFSRDQLEVIGLANDDSSALCNYIKEQNIPYPNTLAGKELIRSYGISAYPTTFLIAPDGNILAKNLRGDNLVAIVKEKMQIK
ncbi:redoxin domain-containing protein [candidate division KSB1 bacterium]|nr:redoxin domain-containing protein [candidate division KSB1 bacterium]